MLTVGRTNRAKETDGIGSTAAQFLSPSYTHGNPVLSAVARRDSFTEQALMHHVAPSEVDPSVIGHVSFVMARGHMMIVGDSVRCM